MHRTFFLCFSSVISTAVFLSGTALYLDGYVHGRKSARSLTVGSVSSPQSLSDQSQFDAELRLTRNRTCHEGQAITDDKVGTVLCSVKYGNRSGCEPIDDLNGNCATKVLLEKQIPEVMHGLEAAAILR